MSSQMVCSLLGLAHYRAIGVSCRFSLKPIVGEISLPTPYPSLFRVSLATNSLEFRRKKDGKKTADIWLLSPKSWGYYHPKWRIYSSHASTRSTIDQPHWNQVPSRHLVQRTASIWQSLRHLGVLKAPFKKIKTQSTNPNAVCIFPLVPYKCNVDCWMQKTVQCQVWSE